MGVCLDALGLWWIAFIGFLAYCGCCRVFGFFASGLVCG